MLILDLYGYQRKEKAWLIGNSLKKMNMMFMATKTTRHMVLPSIKWTHCASVHDSFTLQAHKLIQHREIFWGYTLQARMEGNMHCSSAEEEGKENRWLELRTDENNRLEEG